ncbi:MAG: hypothetical protein BWK80_27075 [Desulfobacteraceae bacterium IS3]|nr:MAG: hypothetical protein BWK80_27075 [Desulfobacteraceae bacterium IS3]
MYRKDRLFYLIEQLGYQDLLFLLKNGLQITEKKYERYSHEQLKYLFSAELREAASNSFANYFRLKHEYPYKQILIDVADKLVEKQFKMQNAKCKVLEDCTEEEIEDEILRLFELKTQIWWKSLTDKEKEQLTGKINGILNAEQVNTVNRKSLIRYRINKELMDSVITKGIIVAMLTMSAGGFLGVIGGSLLSQIGLSVVVHLRGLMSGLRVLTGGLFGLRGIASLDMIGGIAAGIAVFVPSTIYFYADSNYNKIIPTIIMLLSKVRVNKSTLTF